MIEKFEFESACEESQRQAETAMRSVSRLLSGLKAMHKAAKIGDLQAIHRSTEELAGLLQLVRGDVGNASVAWPMDEASEIEYVSQGGYQNELLACAAESGLSMSEQDGMLVCYPSLIRIDGGRRCVLIDRKPFKSLRPSVLVSHMKAQQTRPPKFKPTQFLESLYTAWDYARHLRAKGHEPAGNVRVDHIYAALTIAPGSSRDYTKPEFGRDLYLLEKSGEQVTRKGAVVHFSRSTGTKAAGFITVVGEDGAQVDYSSIEFGVD